MPKPPPPSEAKVRSWIADWRELKDSLAQLKAEESVLRAKIIAAVCPEPDEGINRFVTAGLEIVLDHKIERKVDEAVLDSPKFQVNLRAAKVSADELFRYKPELNLRPYRKLQPNQLHLLDSALIIKPGSTKLEIL